jgi:DNA-binding MarR family transcriptional regulator
MTCRNRLEFGAKTYMSGNESRSEATGAASEGSADTGAIKHGEGFYTIEDQVGFMLRRANQRHTEIFQTLFGKDGLTALQFSALVKIRDEGRVSQNQLGRLTHMDPATIMGVISRLTKRGLIRKGSDSNDKRKTVLMLTADALKLIESLESTAHQVTARTLQPLSPGEQKTFLRLLASLT